MRDQQLVFSWLFLICCCLLIQPPQRALTLIYPRCLTSFCFIFPFIAPRSLLLGANLPAIADGVLGCCAGRQGRAVSVPVSVSIYTYSYMYTYIRIYISLSSLPLSVSLSKSNLYLCLYLYEISRACK